MDTAALDSVLAQSLGLSLPPDRPGRSGSVAVSRSGALYPAGYVGSQTHLLDTPSELAALVRAVQHNDVHVEAVYTTVPDPSTPLSPLVVKLLIDHGARTGTPLRYYIRDISGKVLLESSDVRELLPWYPEPSTPLVSITGRVADSATGRLDPASDLPTEMQLREWALKGRTRNFPTYDAASGYGAAILTNTGDIYYGGQYSTFDHRLGVHAEMGVLINAIMDGARDITHIGIVSSKFPDTPCSPCGCCLQFVSEISRKYDFSPIFCLFASENEQYVTYTTSELLPAQWTNKK